MSATSNVDIGEEVIAVVYTPKHRRRNVDFGVHSCTVACTISYIRQIWVWTFYYTSKTDIE